MGRKDKKPPEGRAVIVAAAITGICAILAAVLPHLISIWLR